MRNQSIDCVKALAAILMVYAHLYVVNLDSNFHIGIIYSFHMPAFAFVSGMFFTTKRNVLDFLSHKSLQLLLPTYIFWCLFFPLLSDIYLGNDIHLFSYFRNLYYSIFHWQVYWFVWALYLCFLYGYSVIKIFKNDYVLVLSMFFLWIISWLEIIPNRCHSLVGFIFLYPFFVSGYYFNRYKSSFPKYNRKRTIVLSFVIYLALIVLFWRGWPDTWYIMNTGIFATESNPECGITGLLIIWKTLTRFFIGTSASVFIVLFCEWLFEKADKASKFWGFGKSVLFHLSDIGKYTLPIYLLSGILQSYIVPFVGGIKFARLFDTILIVYLCYFVAVITSKNKWLGLFLWGKTFQRKSLRR